MKILKRVKLINWHRFTNTTIEFGASTLLSGENGAGKSTLLDAIQFVVTCSTNYFNKAAHENGKRKLTGYIRCKTGKENKPYERTGEISAHVALEFYEDSKKQYFIVGAVIDSASEGQETTVRYLMDHTRFTEDMFFQGKTPRSITQFRSANSGKIKMWCKTGVEAKKMIKTRFGRIEDKFFTLIPKALAFRPIDDIKDFVYSYVLDEKEVNIDILRENVRTYQELEKTLESVKRRIAKLEIIEEYHKQVLDGLEKDKMYEYFLERSEVDILGEQFTHEKSQMQMESYRLEQQEKKIQAASDEKNEKQQIRDALMAELAKDEDFLALDGQKKELQKLQTALQEQKEEQKSLHASVWASHDQVIKLSEVKDVDPCVKEYGRILENLEAQEDIAQVKHLTQKVIAYKKQMYDKVQLKSAQVQVMLNDTKANRLELDKKIEQLKQKKLTYPEDVVRVQQAIQKEFSRIGRSPEPRILCELLEITDEQWRNAVEGYLNTQRFYILVEPENFDIALGIYDKLRKEKKAYGVGLINTRKLEKYSEAPEGTLATAVSSKNQYASQFVNMVLGKVQMCMHYSELKNYPISITKECMKYQNHVASAIKPSIFETPFIGQNAVRVQLQQALKEREQISEEIGKLEKQIEELTYVMEPLSVDSDIDIQYRLDVLIRIRTIQTGIEKCKSNIATLEKNASMIQKRIQLETLEKLIIELDMQLQKWNQETGRYEQKIEDHKIQMERLQAERALKQAGVAGLGAAAGDMLPAWNNDYEKQTRNKTFDQFRDNFARRKKGNATTIDHARTNMINAMVSYKTEHDFGAAPSMEGYPDFADVYERLRTSELLKYEEKVQSARRAAEEEFREQFLSKLQENMKQAQSEFKELNRALKDIVFSNEKYEFLYLPSKRYRQYYEMIMDDFNAMQGESIFSGLFHETHKEVIDELFEKLALDNENSAQALDEFTDYRTYMDYDIKIVHSDNSYSYYSKVCEEKSGGETQTPFYVTVAASFVQLYSNNIGGEAIGLIMFDEAFNNMDDERIGGVLEFLRRLPLQIIIAAPPDKIQYISPLVEETLLVMTDEKVSFVERYHNGAV